MRIALIAAAAVVSSILGLSLALLVFGPPNSGDVAVSGAGTSVGVAAIGGPFQLVDHNGRDVDETLLEGKPHLVYFGFTYCPDYCPNELGNMADAHDALAERGVDIGMVFVTIDPKRDTPELLGDYVTAFHDDLIGLTGSPEQIAEAARAYRVIYRENRNPDFADGYTMDHSTFLYAMGPDGKFLTHFTAMTPPQEIADRIIASL